MCHHTRSMPNFIFYYFWNGDLSEKELLLASIHIVYLFLRISWIWWWIWSWMFIFSSFPFSYLNWTERQRRRGRDRQKDRETDTGRQRDRERACQLKCVWKDYTSFLQKAMKQSIVIYDKLLCLQKSFGLYIIKFKMIIKHHVII